MSDFENPRPDSEPTDPIDIVADVRNSAAIGTIAIEFPCAGCGTDLKGLKTGDRCGSCGETVRNSLLAGYAPARNRKTILLVRLGIQTVCIAMILLPLTTLAMTIWTIPGILPAIAIALIAMFGGMLLSSAMHSVWRHQLFMKPILSLASNLAILLPMAAAFSWLISHAMMIALLLMSLPFLLIGLHLWTSSVDQLHRHLKLDNSNQNQRVTIAYGVAMLAIALLLVIAPSMRNSHPGATNTAALLANMVSICLSLACMLVGFFMFDHLRPAIEALLRLYHSARSYHRRLDLLIRNNRIERQQADRPQARTGESDPPPADIRRRDASGIIALKYPCVNCGYNLRGLQASSKCPECGQPIRRSLAANYLFKQDSDYLRTLRHSFWVIPVALLLFVLAAALTILNDPGPAFTATVSISGVPYSTATHYGPSDGLIVFFKRSCYLLALAAAAVGWLLLYSRSRAMRQQGPAIARPAGLALAALASGTIILLWNKAISMPLFIVTSVAGVILLLFMSSKISHIRGRLPGSVSPWPALWLAGFAIALLGFSCMVGQIQKADMAVTLLLALLTPWLMATVSCMKLAKVIWRLPEQAEMYHEELTRLFGDEQDQP